MKHTYLPHNKVCPDCEEELEFFDSGESKKIKWEEWICPECGDIFSDEPDWDSMPGGVDDY